MARVPFVDLQAQYATVRAEIRVAMDEVLDASWFILGRHVESFERAFAEYCGGGEAIGVGSGTDALHLALRACDIGPGDEVITVANTFIATALAIDYVGAMPVFVDVDPVTYTIDVTQIEAQITARTKAILPVHLYGQAADMGPILAMAARHGLAVIEDACQAHGADYAGGEQATIPVRVGNIGHVGCFSFYPTKNLGAYGDGGLVLTQDAALAKRIRLLRNYGQAVKYVHQIRGYNSRLDELQAAVLAAKLPHLEAWNEARRRIAARYNVGITAPHVTLPAVREGVRHVYHLYVIRSPYRDALQRWLAERDIHTQIHYPVPIHQQAAYQGSVPAVSTADLVQTLQGAAALGGHRPTPALPVTEKASTEILSLPIYPELSDAQIEWVIESVNAFEPAGAQLAANVPLLLAAKGGGTLQR